jgi:hypothetical protein
VLARTGLRDDARLAHPLGQQRLGDDVVDLVRAGVVEVLALEDDPGSASMLGEARHLGDDARAAGVGAVEAIELGQELGVDHGLLAGLIELLEGGHEGLGDIAPAERAEPTGCGVRLDG